jgi:hypothetical protein
MRSFTCVLCVHDVWMKENGALHHLNDNQDRIDHDADMDHMPVVIDIEDQVNALV